MRGADRGQQEGEQVLVEVVLDHLRKVPAANEGNQRSVNLLISKVNKVWYMDWIIDLSPTQIRNMDHQIMGQKPD